MTNNADSEIRTKGSLCSGVGGLDAAVPGELAWVSETNEHAASILKREHPDAPNLGDITSHAFSPRSVDLLTSGDPCQSMSIAGRQQSSKDERFLWPFVMDEISYLRPRELFLENVQNITSVALIPGDTGPDGLRGSVLKLRLDNLREAGYAVRWTVLGACAVGAPHHRHRWFLRATHVGPAAPEAVRIVNKCGAPRTSSRTLLASPKASDTFGSGVGRMEEGKKPWHDLPSHVALLPTPNARDGGQRGTPTQEHALRRVANPERSVNLEDAAIAYLLPTPVARDADGRGEGGAEFWNERGQVRGNGIPLGATVNLLPTPRATDIGTPGRRSSEGWRPQLGQAVAENWGKFAAAIALWEQITGMPAPEPTEPNSRGGRRLNPELSEWMMGYPRGFLTSSLTRNEALRCAGNGVVTRQARAAWDLLA